jgi:hypothetical protein
MHNIQTKSTLIDPGVTMSAFAVGKSVIQVGNWLFGIHENHRLLGYDAKVLEQI